MAQLTADDLKAFGFVPVKEPRTYLTDRPAETPTTYIHTSKKDVSPTDKEWNKIPLVKYMNYHGTDWIGHWGALAFHLTDKNQLAIFCQTFGFPYNATA